MKHIYTLITLIMALSMVSCSEDKLDVYNTSYTALNIAKGTVFGDKEQYPEEYSFNAYFLGGNIIDYTLLIPVRLQGTIDNDNDRHYDDSTPGAFDTEYRIVKGSVG